MSRVSVIVGLQWGDEGKGKIADFLSGDYHIIARFQGGANAGHTVKVKGKEYIFHQVPSGLLRGGKVGILGAGMVIDILSLVEELRQLEGVDYRLIVDERAHLVLPYHKVQDARQEESGKGVGSTKRGISQAYRDKYARFGIRAESLLDERILKEDLKRSYEFNKRHFSVNLDFEEIYDILLAESREIKDMVGDASRYLMDALNEGKSILMEGAQGTLLDIDFGTYPYVTSSHTISGGALVGLGFPWKSINEVIGVFKAYTTRVGKGPFPTELVDETGNQLREKGGEYGATTGRPRRVGWLDLVALKYAVWINGVDYLVMTKLDVLFGFPEVKVAVAYRMHGMELDWFPASIHRLSHVEPIYRTFPGFDDIEGARDYISFIEEYLGVPIKIISYGMDREKTIVR